MIEHQVSNSSLKMIILSLHTIGMSKHLRFEMYKVTNGLSPKIMNEIFQIREESRYDLRYTSQFTIPPIHSVYNGRESVSFMAHKIWKLIPPAFKQIKTLSGFKIAIKEWKPSNCPCRLCKTYISQVGFL